MIHGGNVWQGGSPGEWQDHSANLRPGGPPAWVRGALADALERTAYYPDPDMRRATEALAAYLSLPASHVLPTAGGSSAIDLAAQLDGAGLLVCTPCFAEYAARGLAHGKPVRRFSLLQGKQEFSWERMEESLFEGCCVWLCNPLNPVGAAFSLPALKRLLAMVESRNGFLIVDEAERNGGNVTYRLTKDEVEAMRPYFYETPREWVNMGVVGENLAGEYFLSTGSGKFFRNVILDPEDSLCVVEINEAGDSYRIVWGLKNGGRPTSEFPSHFMNHSVRVAATDGKCRVIYHAHPANVIAMTYVLELTDREFSRVLWKSATECPVVFPGGVGVVPWMVPGGAEIAMATCEKMKEYEAAIWAHHGLFVSGPDFDTTFGLMHTIEKSAQIWVLAMSCGQGIRQTIEDDELRAIAVEFGVKLREEFLD